MISTLCKKNSVVEHQAAAGHPWTNTKERHFDWEVDMFVFTMWEFTHNKLCLRKKKIERICSYIEVKKKQTSPSIAADTGRVLQRILGNFTRQYRLDESFLAFGPTRT